MALQVTVMEKLGFQENTFFFDAPTKTMNCF